jgi:hypothetical protein
MVNKPKLQGPYCHENFKLYKSPGWTVVMGDTHMDSMVILIAYLFSPQEYTYQILWDCAQTPMLS